VIRAAYEAIVMALAIWGLMDAIARLSGVEWPI